MLKTHTEQICRAEIEPPKHWPWQKRLKFMNDLSRFVDGWEQSYSEES